MAARSEWSRRGRVVGATILVAALACVLKMLSSSASSPPVIATDRAREVAVQTAAAEIRDRDAEASAVAVDSPQRSDLTIGPTTIDLTFVDAKGKPCVDLPVRIVREDDLLADPDELGEVVRTDSAGHITKSIEPGRIFVESVPIREKVMAPAGERVTRVLRASPGRAVHGIVIDSRAMRVRDANIWLGSTAPGYPVRAGPQTRQPPPYVVMRSDGNGEFSIADIGQADEIQATAGSFLVSRSCGVTGERVVIRLEAAAAARIRVVTPDGRPVAAAQVSIDVPRVADRRQSLDPYWVERRWFEFESPTSASGDAEVTCLPVGEIRVHAWARGFKSATATIVGVCETWNETTIRLERR